MSTPFRIDLLLRGNLPYVDGENLPFWYQWDGDLSRLIEPLQEALAQAFAPEVLTQRRERDPLMGRQRNRAL